MCVVVFVGVRGRAHWRAACSAAGCQGLNRAASEVRFRGENNQKYTHYSKKFATLCILKSKPVYKLHRVALYFPLCCEHAQIAGHILQK